jgi:hypothetical protein
MLQLADHDFLNKDMNLLMVTKNDVSFEVVCLHYVLSIEDGNVTLMNTFEKCL